MIVEDWIVDVMYDVFSDVVYELVFEVVLVVSVQYEKVCVFCFDFFEDVGCGGNCMLDDSFDV